ncbi:radical SAM protein [candidate division KSB1 bacterium]|nr:radical SAM protein [candidate division KSB1 bacterium]
MTVKEITAKSILRKHKRLDSWFISCYGMNLYRGCVHDCVYCDGRAEKYNVEGEFGREVAVKTNALAVLDRELDPARKRKPLKPCYIMLGGGVGDGYQIVEKQYNLTRGALELMLRYNLPVSVLTKSTLVEKDLDLLKQINRQTRALVSFSFSSVDEKISAIFEPGVPSPKKRLQCMKKIKERGIASGMFLMPVIPFITDSAELMEQSVSAAKDAGADFILFSGMTMKQGRQKDYFMRIIREFYPHLEPEYGLLYPPNPGGGAIEAYYQSIFETFYHLARAYRMPMRVPLPLFEDILEENDKVMVMLEHMDYVLKSLNRISPYGYAAWSISKLDVPLSSMRDKLRHIKGVGPATEKIILEILDTGNCRQYRDLVEFAGV